MNIIEHPSRKQRIADAKTRILRSLCRSDLPRDVSGPRWGELLTTALVHELEIPASGVAALRRAFARETSHLMRLWATATTKRQH
jgi:hypothetical protein